MEDIYFILFLVSISFLILGLISPKTSLFWAKSTRTRGKSILIYGLGTIVFLVAFGETANGTEIKLTDYINVDKSLTLTITNEKEKTLNINDKKTVEPNSEKFKELLKWGENNLNDWESTSASYLGLISVSQDNFNLMYFKDGFVVLNFVDKEGKGNQYKKEIKPGELDFLLN